jgi:hypothetical protein
MPGAGPDNLSMLACRQKAAHCGFAVDMCVARMHTGVQAPTVLTLFIFHPHLVLLAAQPLESDAVGCPMLPPIWVCS